MDIAEVHIIKCTFIVKTIIQHLRLCLVLGACSNFLTTSLITTSSIEIYSVTNGYFCVSRPLTLALVPGPNLYLMAPAPSLSFTAPALTVCLPALHLTVKVCYSYSFYLYNLSVFLCVI